MKKIFIILHCALMFLSLGLKAQSVTDLGVVWQKNDFTTEQSSFQNITKQTDGTYLATGWIMNSGRQVGYIVHFNEGGTKLNEWVVTPPNVAEWTDGGTTAISYLRCAYITSTGDIMAFGLVFNTSATLKGYALESQAIASSPYLQNGLWVVKVTKNTGVIAVNKLDRCNSRIGTDPIVHNEDQYLVVGFDYRSNATEQFLFRIYDTNGDWVYDNYAASGQKLDFTGYTDNLFKLANGNYLLGAYAEATEFDGSTFAKKNKHASSPPKTDPCIPAYAGLTSSTHSFWGLKADGGFWGNTRMGYKSNGTINQYYGSVFFEKDASDNMLQCIAVQPPSAIQTIFYQQPLLLPGSTTNYVGNKLENGINKMYLCEDLPSAGFTITDGLQYPYNTALKATSHTDGFFSCGQDPVTKQAAIAKLSTCVNFKTNDATDIYLPHSSSVSVNRTINYQGAKGNAQNDVKYTLTAKVLRGTVNGKTAGQVVETIPLTPVASHGLVSTSYNGKVLDLNRTYTIGATDAEIEYTLRLEDNYTTAGVPQQCSQSYIFKAIIFAEKSVFADTVWFFGQNKSGDKTSPGIIFDNYIPTDASNQTKVNSQGTNFSMGVKTCDGYAFYSTDNGTNGIMYNRHHLPMKNGTFPAPANSTDGYAGAYVGGNKYAFFAVSPTGDLNYYLVDMNKDGGNGELIWQKEVSKDVAQGIELFPREGTTDEYWLVYYYHSSINTDNAELRVTLLSGKTLTAQPALSQPIPFGIENIKLPAMVRSGNNKQLAILTSVDDPFAWDKYSYVDIYDINLSTGALSNHRGRKLTSNMPGGGSGDQYFSLSFSPDGNYVALAEDHNAVYVVGTDAAATDYGKDDSSAPGLVGGSPGAPRPTEGGGLKLGPDGVMYFKTDTYTYKSTWYGSEVAFSECLPTGDNGRNFSIGLTPPSIDPKLAAVNDTVTVISKITVPVLENDNVINCSFSCLTAHTVTNGNHGTAVWNATKDSIIYTVNSHTFEGKDSVSYSITCLGKTSTAKVYLTVIKLPDNITDAECYTTPQGFQWTIEKKMEMPGYIFSTIVTGDLDNDSYTDILVQSHYLLAENRSKGITLYKGPDFTQKIEHSFSFALSPNSLATAKIKIAEGLDTVIVATFDHNNNKIVVVAFDKTSNTFKFLWDAAITKPSTLPNEANAIGFADFNNDGYTELYLGNYIFDAATGLQLTKGSDNMGFVAYSVNNSYGVFSVAADVLGDSRLELCAGSQVYDVNIVSRTNASLNSMTVISSADLSTTALISMKDGATVVADINNDGSLDLVVQTSLSSSNGTRYLYAWNPASQKLMAITSIAGSTNANVPFVGNLDNKGLPEIVLLYAKSPTPHGMAAFNYNSTININANDFGFKRFWATDYAHTDNSGATGMTLFDFNQDNIPEIVYRDEQNLRIINGSGTHHVTGLPSAPYDLFSTPAYSGTVFEYPIVADVDNDGHAEILITATDFPPPNNTSANAHNTGKLKIYKGKDDYPWAPARKVWNQYAYNAVNVNNDLTIPKYQLSPATVFAGADGVLGTADDVRPYNGFLQQQTSLNQNGTPLWLTPNAQITHKPVFNYDVAKDSMTISVTVHNVGDAAFLNPFKITAYKNTVGGTPKLNYSYAGVINAGDSAVITFGIPKFKQNWTPLNNIIIRANDNGNGYNDQMVCDSAKRDYKSGAVLASEDHFLVFENSNGNILRPTANDIKPTTCTDPKVQIVTGAKYGTATATGNDSIITYKPTANYIGRDTLKYEIICGGVRDTAMVYITVVPKPDNITDAECYAAPKGFEFSFDPNPTQVGSTLINYSPVIAGDLDGDSIPELVSVGTWDGDNWQGQRVHIFMGKNRSDERFITLPGSARVSLAGGSVALGRIKYAIGVDTSLIFIAGLDSYLYAYSLTNLSLPVWKSDSKFPNTQAHTARNAQTLGIADFNNDGYAEVYINNSVFDAATGKFICRAPTNSNEGYSNAHTGNPISLTIAADVDNDGKLELMAGNTVWKVAINRVNNTNITGSMSEFSKVTLPSDLTGAEDGHTQIVDLNGDGNLDIVVSKVINGGSKTGIYVWNPLSKSIIAYTTCNSGTNGGTAWYQGYGKGVPFIGDIDGNIAGNKAPEIILLTDKIRAYKYDGTNQLKQFWELAHTDVSYGTGMTLFDFNQDGSYEIVYRDVKNLRIIDGSTNTPYNLAEILCTSGTLTEYPIVLDVNNDGSAEIVVTGGVPQEAAKILIYKPLKGSWAPARPVWNQYAYNAVNVNNDLTIPKYQLSPATVFPGVDGVLGTADDVRPYNAFLQQQTSLNQNGTPLWLTPNAQITHKPVFNYDVAKDSMTISVTVHNVGDAAFLNPFKITAYKNTVGGTPKLNYSYAGVINAGDSAVITFGIPKFKQNWTPFNNIIIRANDNGNGYNDQMVCDSAKRDYKSGAILASEDHFLVFENSNGNILRPTANDIKPTTCTDPKVQIVTGAKYGTATATGNDSIITYKPTANYVGRDTLQYEIICGGVRDTTMVYITVVPKPDNITDAECFTTPPKGTWSIKQNWKSPNTKLIDANRSFFVGDLDGDKLPEIVAIGNIISEVPGVSVAYESREIVVFPGNDRDNPVTLNVESYRTYYPIAPFVLTKVGGKGLIIISGVDGYLYAYDYPRTSASYIWKSDKQTVDIANKFDVTNFEKTGPSLSVADFNNDGVPEVYSGNRIFNAQTGTFIASTPASLTDATIEATVPNRGFSMQGGLEKGSTLSLAADVDNDGQLELIVGNQIFKAVNPDGTFKATLELYKSIMPPMLTSGVQCVNDGHISIADFNNDGYLDVLVSLVHKGTSAVLYGWDVKNNTIMFSYDTPYATRSLPFIGDIDGDKKLEIIFMGQQDPSPAHVRALKLPTVFSPTAKLSQFWALQVNESTGRTGITLFDFDQDGVPELVYRDMTTLYIIDGSKNPAVVKTSYPNIYSPTTWEYPIVADVDADGEAEIVVSGSSGTSVAMGNLFIFKSNGFKWAPARKVWNQYAYNAVNVNNDLTIPKYQLSPATVFAGADGVLGTADDVRPYNAFLQQQTSLNQNGTPLWLTPNGQITDKPVFSYDVAKDSMTISVTVHNAGDAAFKNPFKITAYKDVVGGTPKLTYSYAGVINAGDSAVITFGIPKFKQNWTPLNNIIIRANDNGNGYNDQMVCDSAKRDYKSGAVLASEDHFLVFENSSGNILRPTANDIKPTTCTDPKVQIVTGAKYGTATATGNDSIITYNPTANYLGRDTLQYEIICGGVRDTAMVYITVVPKPDNITEAECYVEPLSDVFSIRMLPQHNNTGAHTYFIPIVGDVDDDGVPEILVAATETSYRAKNIKIINGKTGAVKTTVTTPSMEYTSGHAIYKVNGVTHLVIPVSSDYSVVAERLLLRAYKYVKATDTWEDAWTSDKPYSDKMNPSYPSIVDLDGDGTPEIIIGQSIFNGLTGTKLADFPAGSTSTVGATSAIGDFLKLGSQQIVINNKLYSVQFTNKNGFNSNAFTLKATAPSTTYSLDRHSVVADFNMDGYLDVLFVGPNTAGTTGSGTIVCAIWDVKNNTFLGGAPLAVAHSSAGGFGLSASVPLVADINNDGNLEFIFMSYNKLFCYQYNHTDNTISQYWTFGVTDQSGQTGITLFDFNQDKKVELVYRDETSLRILDGSQKNNCKQVAIFNNVYSGTGYEYSIVADVDGDNLAEIVTIGNPTSINYTGTVYVLGPNVGKGWAPARPVWNQYAYNAVNVNKDLTIPRYPLSPATVFPGADGVLGTADDVRPYNAFLQQQTSLNQNGTPLWLTPNAQIGTPAPSFNYSAAGDSMQIKLVINNVGDAALKNPVKITVYKDVVGATPKYTYAYPNAILAGGSATVSFAIPNFKTWLGIVNSTTKLIVKINDNGNGYNDQTVCDSSNVTHTKPFGNLLMANTDYASTFSNDTIRVNVLANDSTATCTRNALTAFDTIPASGLKNGTLVINADSTFTYTPKSNFAGIDSVTYYIKCGIDSSAAKVYFMTVKPNAQHYTACSGAIVNMGVNTLTGVSFYWYTTATGGTRPTLPSLTYNLTKNASALQTVWVEPEYKGITYPRIPMYLSLASGCGEDPKDCAKDGTVIFKEDFGGNEVSDPDPSIISLPAGTTDYLLNTTVTPLDGTYALRKRVYKEGEAERTTWHQFDDHTIPGYDKGYMMLVCANATPGMFYKTTINDLCQGSELFFSAWIGNLVKATYEPLQQKYPDLRFVIQDATSLSVLAEYYTGDIPNGDSWKNYGFTFKPESSSIIFSIYNKAPGGIGNDLVLDDIEIRFCAPPIVVLPGNDTTVCLGSKLDLQLKDDYVDDGTFGNKLDYQWEFKAKGTLPWDLVSGTAGSSTNGHITAAQTKHTIASTQVVHEGDYRFMVAAIGNINSVNCRATGGFTLTVAKAPFKYPDVRIQLCAQPNRSIFLNSYLDTLELKSIAWTKLSSTGAIGVNTGEIQTNDLLKGTYVYRYSVENLCVKDSAKVYVKVLGSFVVNADTVVICKDMLASTLMNLRQIFGLEAGGTITAVTAGAGTYLSHMAAPSLYRDAYYFKARAAWDDPAFAPITYNGDDDSKVFEFEYQPALGSCVNYPVKLVLIVTGSLIP